MAEEGLIRLRMSQSGGHMLERSSTASVLVVEAVSNCKVFQTKQFLAADNLIAAKHFFSFLH